MQQFVRKGMGRIFTDREENVNKIKEIIRQVDAYEADYMPSDLIAVYTPDDPVELVYAGKFAIDLDALLAACREQDVTAACVKGQPFSDTPDPEDMRRLEKLFPAPGNSLEEIPNAPQETIAYPPVPIIPEGKQLTREEAIALDDSGWWKDKTAWEIAGFQLNQPRLCMPFDKFHEAVEAALGRPVWTHEFAVKGRLQSEYDRVRQAHANGTSVPKTGINDVVACFGQLVGDDAPNGQDAPAEDEGPQLLSPGQ